MAVFVPARLVCVSKAAAELMLWRRWLSGGACVAELYPRPSWKVLGCCCSHATCVGWRFAFLLVRALGDMYYIGNGAGFRAVGTTIDRPVGRNVDELRPIFFFLFSLTLFPLFFWYVPRFVCGWRFCLVFSPGFFAFPSIFVLRFLFVSCPLQLVS